MKKIIIILINVLITTSIFAQVPQKMSYQAIIRNAGNHLVINKHVGVKINIHRDSTTGAIVYTETQTPVTNTNGLLTIEIGGQTGFDTINWANGSYFLEVETDPKGGNNYTIVGVSQLLTVPYALHAKTAESIIDTSKHYIGELYGGGIVFWVTPDGHHGLIASLDDLDGGNGVTWSADDTTKVGIGAQSMTDGASNTAAIVAHDNTAGHAATLCNNYTGGGYTDWYLPSNRELYLLASQDVLINYILNNDGDETTNGFSQNYVAPTYGAYWSSTEYDKTHSWYYNFFGGYMDFYWYKNKTYRVRAIRAF